MNDQKITKEESDEQYYENHKCQGKNHTGVSLVADRQREYSLMLWVTKVP